MGRKQRSVQWGLFIEEGSLLHVSENQDWVFVVHRLVCPTRIGLVHDVFHIGVVSKGHRLKRKS